MHVHVHVHVCVKSCLCSPVLTASLVKCIRRVADTYHPEVLETTFPESLFGSLVNLLRIANHSEERKKEERGRENGRKEIARNREKERGIGKERQREGGREGGRGEGEGGRKGGMNCKCHFNWWVLFPRHPTGCVLVVAPADRPPWQQTKLTITHVSCPYYCLLNMLLT